MFKLIELITLGVESGDAARSTLRDQLEAATRAQSGIVRSRLEQTGAFAVNGGDLHWVIEFEDEQTYLDWQSSGAGRAAHNALSAERGVHVDRVAYHQGTTVLAEPAIQGGIHRTLLLAIRPMIEPRLIREFELEMRDMAHYVPVIRNWALSRVIHASGARPWTHVWEQDFHREADLVGPYMMHPIHFAWIDRWFDCQSQDWIVDNQLCHSYCPASQSMIAPAKK